MAEIEGTAGADTLNGDGGNNTMHGGGGSDTMTGANGHDTMHGGGGADDMQGGNGTDTLYGGNGRDNLEGGNGDDALYGGNGNDRLYGGSGDDTMVGGNGDDIFVFDGDNVGLSVDTIEDFDVSRSLRKMVFDDEIELTNVDGDTVAYQQAGNDVELWINGTLMATFSGSQGALNAADLLAVTTIVGDDPASIGVI